MPELSLLTLGAGAIGTYIGGSLALAGHRVTFVERPAVAQDLRARGLKLQLEDGAHHLPSPVVVGSLEEALHARSYDLAIFALKSYHTSAFVASLGTLTGSMPPILCLSNGVDNEPMLAEALGPQNVLAGTVTSAIGRNAAGDIVLERLRGVGVTCPPKDNNLARQITQALNEAGLKARCFPRAADMKWSKMLTNLLANASAAILDMSPAEIFSHPDLYALEIRQLREALLVMKAQGIRAVDLPGTPVRALAYAVRWLPPSVSRPLLAKAVGKGRGGKMPSFHIDLHSGRGQSEVEYLNGAVARAGQQYHIDTPVNEQLTTTLLALTRDEIPLERFRQQPEKLLDQLLQL